MTSINNNPGDLLINKLKSHLKEDPSIDRDEFYLISENTLKEYFGMERNFSPAEQIRMKSEVRDIFSDMSRINGGEGSIDNADLSVDFSSAVDKQLGYFSESADYLADMYRINKSSATESEYGTFEEARLDVNRIAQNTEGLSKGEIKLMKGYLNKAINIKGRFGGYLNDSISIAEHAKSIVLKIQNGEKLTPDELKDVLYTTANYGGEGNLPSELPGYSPEEMSVYVKEALERSAGYMSRLNH